MASEETKHITVRIPKELHKAARLKSVHKDCSLSDIVRAALESYVLQNGQCNQGQKIATK